MKIGSLFSGIGGLDLGLERAGLGHTVWQCEQNEFCQRVLAKHWPDAALFEDIKHLWFPEKVDLMCGGFPCQNLSVAGKKEGLSGKKSGLWKEFIRLIRSVGPEWVVIENVQQLWKKWVPFVRGDLSEAGYASLPLQLSAAEVGAPHLRRRVFLVAHTNSKPLRELQRRWSGKNGEGETLSRFLSEERSSADSHGNGESAKPIDAQASWLFETTRDGGRLWRPPVSPVCGVDDGLSNRLDRLRALGNAVVPQCAEVVGRAIKEIL